MSMIVSNPTRNLKTVAKVGGAMLVDAVKKFQVGRMDEATLDRIVGEYTNGIANQIVSLDAAQKLQNAKLNTIINILKTQQTRLNAADKILENMDGEKVLAFFRNLIAAKAFRDLMDAVIAFFHTAKGRMTLAVFLLLAARTFDQLFLGGLATKGTVRTGKFFIKKLSNTKSLLKKILYFMMFLLSSLTKRRRRNSPVKFNSRPVINLTPAQRSRSRKQTTPKRSAL